MRLKTIIFILLVMALGTFLSKSEYYNPILYSLFAIVMLSNLYKNIYSNYLIRNKMIHTGEITGFETIDTNDSAKENCFPIVNFISPYDNNEYNLKLKLNKKPADNIVHLKINKKNPLKSKIVEETPLWENIILAAISIFFCYLFIKSI